MRNGTIGKKNPRQYLKPVQLNTTNIQLSFFPARTILAEYGKKSSVITQQIWSVEGMYLRRYTRNTRCYRRISYNMIHTYAVHTEYNHQTMRPYCTEK